MKFSNLSTMMCFHAQDGESSDHYIRFSANNWLKANGETKSWCVVDNAADLEKAFNESIQREMRKLYMPYA